MTDDQRPKPAWVDDITREVQANPDGPTAQALKQNVEWLLSSGVLDFMPRAKGAVADTHDRFWGDDK